MRSAALHPLVLAISTALLSPGLLAQAQDNSKQQADEQKIEQIVVTGTRVAGRSVDDTAVPIDIVGVETLERSGSSELNQVLSVALPSFNFPRPGLADGTDTIRPATLRGLGPDQSLVLVNSKRRHAASLVNVNGTVGRGSSAVDLNTIPTAAIRSVEVLRDGASAQYGSDAIAGVINVRLRDASEGGSVTFSYGYRDSAYTVPVTPPPADATWNAPAEIKRSVSDGETINLSGWKGFALPNNGYLTLAAEIKDAERTERGGYDYRQQYPLVGGEYDPREQTIERFNAWYGEPELQQFTLFANAGMMLKGGKLYSWASFQDRSARSGGFYRRAQDDRNVIEVHPDGFLPIIAPEVTDTSFALGYEWELAQWSMDASVVYGMNEMAFTIENTVNRSIGPTSKTEFDAGGFDYDQWVFNFSGVTSFDIASFASPVNMATGIEIRREGYSIFAGEPDSYRNGGVLLPNGNPTQSGAQVFPGFRPANAVDESRRAVGVYIDLEANITDNLLGSVAFRAEDYSDFGSNVTGKLALRYDVNDSVGLRGSVQNGFRAPSLQQQYFTSTSTNFIGGVPFDITTFPVNDPAAIALGSSPLDAEESVNLSLGAVFRLGDLTLTIDGYQINIDDRIVLSENLTQPNVRAYLESLGLIGIGGGRFFINGVDTETQGIDIVANYPVFTADIGRFDLILVANVNSTDVTRTPATAELSALDPAPELFGRVNVLTFEEGNPKNKLGAHVNWSLERFGATFRATRYGEVLTPNANPANDFTLDAKTLLDVEARYQLTAKMRLAFGADNLLDEYPDAFPINLNGTGNTPFSNYSPYGRSGRLVYGRVSYDF
ncbi:MULTISPECIES: TonB-dependent receptor plug domain-containing protein [unclassified Arsukibacterium]|uniref:TonB-dependent receptor plug domain-containing protein n=3 Tax=Arsukibacterium TaxID=336830 RepID=UPI000C69F81E|nr:MULTISPECIES: TonB-dependent receptor [unclassified Arsukibacterium]MBM34783.1 TonB-dependent receptor [Rheinheimera sp.]|tara:strand:- start:21865 stop:24366 length:2502 start_codon:yes stop_codon:yes gene_type:complete